MQQFWTFLGNSHSEFIHSAPLLLSPPSELETLKPSWIPPFPSFHESVQVCSVRWILCDPMDCSPLGSPAHGISQARKLEWVAISSSRGSSWPRDWTCISCIGRWILYHLRHLRSVYILPLCWSDASKLNSCKVNKAKFSNYRELGVALNPCVWTGFFLLFQIAIPIPCVLKWPLSHAAGFY